MHITRVAVTLALAASTANALPWSKSRGDANAPGMNADNLDTTRDIHRKVSSPDSMHSYMKMGVSSNQPIQKEMMMVEGSSLSASQKMSLGHEHDIKSDLVAATAPDKQSERMIHFTRATESQLDGESSAMSSCSNKMPVVQQKVMEIRHHDAAKDANHSANNFAVKARGLFRAFGQTWDQRAKVEHDEQQQGITEYTTNTHQDKSQMFMSMDKENTVNGQGQQAADSMSQVEKVRQVRNHENYNQKSENESADIHAQQHSAMHQNHNYARSHMDGSDVQADGTEQMNSQQNLDQEQHQQQQVQEPMQEQMQEQMQERMQEQMQVRSQVAEDLQSAMDDVHSLRANEQDSE